MANWRKDEGQPFSDSESDLFLLQNSSQVCNTPVSFQARHEFSRRRFEDLVATASVGPRSTLDNSWKGATCSAHTHDCPARTVT
jgi:hypothetical protein